MNNLKKTVPIEELNLDDSIEKVKNELLDKKEKCRERFIKEEIECRSLERLANATIKFRRYAPYLLDFGMIIERIKGENERDRFDDDSLEIKRDLLEQLSKMKNVPPYSEECHIESKYVGKCTSISSFIRKFVFRKKKYRLVFHGKEATYKKVNYITFYFKFFTFVNNILDELV